MKQTNMLDTLCGNMTDLPRVISAAELAVVCQSNRKTRGWSQDTLAALAGLTVRTVQRVEAGKPSSRDTRRALARAFEEEDIDTFNKMRVIKTVDEFEAEQRKGKEEFERRYVTIGVQTVTGRGIARLWDNAQAACVELSGPSATRPEVEDVFAELKDFILDYIDIFDQLSAAERLSVGDDLQRRVESLDRLGCVIVGGRRELRLPLGNDENTIEITSMYLLVIEKGKEPAVLSIPRSAGVSF